jgi:hypothetical protein
MRTVVDELNLARIFLQTTSRGLALADAVDLEEVVIMRKPEVAANLEKHYGTRCKAFSLLAHG